ncbi:galactokinase [Geochorda subterranea]|uniref:Galactokinase n=1 Tax=Geochorda subterranea TaxID=3109564 RepID=A0ABZ1BMB3_9FIRM|nr:galactokinase [Limnochorda sp. LNt]WRP13648.1 galactokinase [Limnochorda sp. LNt]
MSEHERGFQAARRAVEGFERRWGTPPAVLARAPGRVNLIGEHTDYTGGFVLPVAIDRDVVVAGRARPDDRVCVYSADFDQSTCFELDEARLDDVRKDSRHPWSDYVRGVYAVLRAEGLPVTGADLAIAGDVPQGAGLSSSAALEVATLLFAQVTGRFEVEPVRAALLARRAENEFVGVACGIMDQFVSRLARRDAALLVDTDSLRYEHVPLPPDVAIVVTDTRVRRRLVGSEYNRRRQQCEEALAIARRHVSGWRLVREIRAEQLPALHDVAAPVLMRRLRHLVEENARVLEAVRALRDGDLGRLGELMAASHASLRDLFEVSCPELDAAVEIARAVPGVYGARMTGAGFGGCTVTLARPDAVPALLAALEAEYPRRTGKTPQIFVLRAAQGADWHAL